MKDRYTVSQKKYLKEFGENVRGLRLNKGLSQEDLALKAKLDRTYIGSIERGERNISLLNLKKIADALGVNMVLFFNKKGEE